MEILDEKGKIILRKEFGLPAGRESGEDIVVELDEIFSGSFTLLVKGLKSRHYDINIENISIAENCTESLIARKIPVKRAELGKIEDLPVNPQKIISGVYTDYGDVSELLEKTDGNFLVIRVNICFHFLSLQ